jgi:hypothetical protein
LRAAGQTRSRIFGISLCTRTEQFGARGRWGSPKPQLHQNSSMVSGIRWTAMTLWHCHPGATRERSQLGVAYIYCSPRVEVGIGATTTHSQESAGRWRWAYIRTYLPLWQRSAIKKPEAGSRREWTRWSVSGDREHSGWRRKPFRPTRWPRYRQRIEGPVEPCGDFRGDKKKPRRNLSAERRAGTLTRRSHVLDQPSRREMRQPDLSPAFHR